MAPSNSLFLAAAALAVLVCHAAVAQEPGMGRRYLMPRWYTAVVEPTVDGDKVSVKACLTIDQFPMKKARVRLEASPGLEMTSCAAVALPASPAADRKPAGPLISKGVARGLVPPDTRLTFEATFLRKQPLQHGYITLAFDYDFPDQEILSYIIAHSQDKFPDDKLRDLLSKTIREGHPGRRSEGVTERVEFGPDRPK